MIGLCQGHVGRVGPDEGLSRQLCYSTLAGRAGGQPWWGPPDMGFPDAGQHGPYDLLPQGEQRRESPNAGAMRRVAPRRTNSAPT